MGLSELRPAGTGQAELFVDEKRERARRMERAVDEIRNALGRHVLKRARMIDPAGDDG